MPQAGAVVIKIDGDESGFEQSVKETHRTASSAAAALGAEYKKAGMTMSEAMSKAWKDIRAAQESGSSVVINGVETIIDANDKLAKSTEKISENGYEPLAKSAHTAAGKINKDLDSVEKKTSKLATGIKKAGSIAATAFKGIAIVGSVVSAAWSAVGIGSVKYNANIEQLQKSFETMTGSAEKAAAIIDRLRSIGAITPFATEDLAETTQLLMQYNVDADRAVDMMMMLGDVSQGNAEKMKRIATAYGQMHSAQKVQLEDVKQMQEAGFSPLLEISERTGESMAILYDRISKGTLAVEEITQAMVYATSEGGRFYKSMEKQSETVLGLLSTLKDELEQLGGAAFEPVSDALRAKVLPEAINLVRDMQEAYKRGGLDGMADALIAQIPKLVDAAETALGKMTDGLQKKLPAVVKKLISQLPKLISGANQIAPQIADTIFEVIAVAAEGVTAKLPELAPLILEGIGKMLLSVGKGVYRVTEGVFDGLEQAMKDIGILSLTPQDAFDRAWANVDTSQYKDYEVKLGINITPEEYESKIDAALAEVRGALENIPGLTSAQRAKIESAIVSGTGMDLLNEVLNNADFGFTEEKKAEILAQAGTDRDALIEALKLMGVSETDIAGVMASYETVSGSLTAGAKSIFKAIAEEYTNGIPETDADVVAAKEAVTGLFEQSYKMIDEWKAQAIKDLEASGLKGEALTSAITEVETEAQGMITELNRLEQEAMEWTENNANKSTAFVNSNLDQLDNIVSRLSDVQAKIDVLNNEQFDSARSRRTLVQSGAVSDVQSQLDAFGITSAELTQRIQEAETEAVAALNTAVEELGDDADGYAAREKEILDQLAQERATAYALYNAEIEKIIRGIAKNNPELSAAIEKYLSEQETAQIATQLRNYVETAIVKAGAAGMRVDLSQFWEQIEASGIDMSALASKLGLTPEELTESITSALKSGDINSRFNDAVNQYVSSINTDFATALANGEIDINKAMPAIKSAIEKGYLQAAGNVDWTSTVTLLQTMLGTSVTEAATGIEDTQDTLNDSAETAVSGIPGTMDISSQTRASGVNAGKGYALGMLSQLSTVRGAGAALAKAATSSLASAQEEGSPSKITRRSGRFFGQGFALGIADEIDNVRESTVRMANAALGSIDSISGNINVSQQANIGGMTSAFANMLAGMNLATDSDVPIQLYVNGRLMMQWMRQDVRSTQATYNNAIAMGVGKK